MLHVQHDYIWPFNQWYHCFVALLLPSPSSFLKLPNCVGTPLTHRRMGIHPCQNSNLLLLNPNLQFKHSILQSKLAIIKFKHSVCHFKHSICHFRTFNSSIQTFSLSIQTFNSAIQAFNSTIQAFSSAIQTLNLPIQTFNSSIQTLNSSIQAFGNSDIQFGNSDILRSLGTRKGREGWREAVSEYSKIPQWLLIGRTNLWKTILSEQEFLYLNLTTKEL